MIKKRRTRRLMKKRDHVLNKTIFDHYFILVNTFKGKIIVMASATYFSGVIMARFFSHIFSFSFFVPTCLALFQYLFTWRCVFVTSVIEHSRFPYIQKKTVHTQYFIFRSLFSQSASKQDKYCLKNCSGPRRPIFSSLVFPKIKAGDAHIGIQLNFGLQQKELCKRGPRGEGQGTGARLLSSIVEGCVLYCWLGGLLACSLVGRLDGWALGWLFGCAGECVLLFIFRLVADWVVIFGSWLDS